MGRFPTPENEAERLKALENYEILDSLDEADFDRITELASLICDTPISLVSLVDEKRQWFKSKVGLDVSETHRDLAFCQHAIMNDALFEVENTLDDDRFSQNELVTGEPNIRFYAGQPLIDPQGFALGTLCVIDRTPKSLSDKQKRALKLLASEVTSLIVERRKKQEAKYFDRLFSLSHDLVCVSSNKGYFIKINPAFHEVLGWDKKHLLTHSFFELIHPNDQFSAKQDFHLLTSGNIPSYGIYKVKTSSGDYKTIQWESTLEPDTGNLFSIGRDVTEQQALKDSLEHARMLLEETGKIARVGGWELDILRQRLTWTGVTKQIHKVDPDYQPNLATSLNFYKEGDDREKITKAIDEAISTGKAWDLELQIINNEGEEIWVRAQGHAEFHEKMCIRLSGTFQDIDDKKRVELEVIAAKKFLDEILTASSEVGIVTTDLNGLITIWNPGAENILGYTAAEMVGKQTTDIFRDRDEVEARKKEIESTYGYEVEGFNIITERTNITGSDQREWTGIKKDGTRIMISSVITPIRDDKNITIGYLSIARDITAEKENEHALITEKARLAAFIEHAPAAVVMLDTEMYFVAASNVWLEDFKMDRNKIIGHSYYESFPNLDETRIKRHKQVLSGEVIRVEEDIFRLPGEDEDLYICWEMRPWYLNDCTIGGMMISVQNITTSVKHREQLKAAVQLAEQASVAKSEFLANMSHEIRTPLNGIIGFTDLLLKTRLNETQQQYLKIVNHSGDALLGIINDILDFSKIEAGKLELEIDKCDLYELSYEAADIITYQIQSKGLEMLLNIPANMPRFIWTDAVRLKQVIVNLLSNAAKFTESGEIELKVELLDTEEELSRFRFSVRDTGIGIKPENLSKIFEAFSQENGSTTKKYGGTGLGLTISNKLLEMMDSRLQLYSTPGEGSVFFFNVSLKAEAGDPIVKSNITQIKRVLIVDDNANNRAILAQMLSLEDIETIQVSNGPDALVLLAADQKFDVIIMDYHMPDMDGLETIARIRENADKKIEDQPFILLYSSSDDDKLIKGCETYHVKQRLVKPVKIQDIYNALSKMYVKHEDHVNAEEPAMETDTSDKKSDVVNILIAEDNPINMLLAKTIIRRLKPEANILEAKNGYAVLELLEKTIPDLILMDIQMPDMNGYEATQKIRELQGIKYIPIIALTAANVKGVKEECVEAGMDDFIVKPVVMETISDILSKWLTKS